MEASSLPSLLPASPTSDPARLRGAISRLAVAYAELEIRAAAAIDEASTLRRERDSAVAKLRDVTEAWGLTQHALRALESAGNHEAGTYVTASLDALRGAALSEAAHTIRVLTEQAAASADAAARAALAVEAPHAALQNEVNRLSRELDSALGLHSARERTFREAAERASAEATAARAAAAAAESRATAAEAAHAAAAASAAAAIADNERLQSELSVAQATAAHASKLAAEVLALREELRAMRK